MQAYAALAAAVPPLQPQSRRVGQAEGCLRDLHLDDRGAAVLAQIEGDAFPLLQARPRGVEVAPGQMHLQGPRRSVNDQAVVASTRHGRRKEGPLPGPEFLDARLCLVALELQGHRILVAERAQVRWEAPAPPPRSRLLRDTLHTIGGAHLRLALGQDEGPRHHQRERLGRHCRDAIGSDGSYAEPRGEAIETKQRNLLHGVDTVGAGPAVAQILRPGLDIAGQLQVEVMHQAPVRGRGVCPGQGCG